MHRAVREKDIEKKLGEWVKTQLGGLYYKFVSPQRRSVPDRIIVKPCEKCPHCGSTAKVLFLELKKPGEKPTDGQAREILRLTDKGAYADWADSVEEAKTKINEI